MIPWSIALLTLWYGIVAVCSAVTVWNMLAGVRPQSALWPLAWFTLSAGATIGLPLLKPWGRTCAIITSVLLILTTLAVAGLFVRAGKPGEGLLIALATAVPLLTIRYLQRPVVKAYFAIGLVASADGKST